MGMRLPSPARPRRGSSPRGMEGRTRFEGSVRRQVAPRPLLLHQESARSAARDPRSMTRMQVARYPRVHPIRRPCPRNARERTMAGRRMYGLAGE